MSMLLEATPAHETYEAVERLIKKICNRFVQVYGGEFDELEGMANVAYTKAYHSYEPGHGTKFSSYISTCIWRHLKQHCDRQRRAVKCKSLSMKKGHQYQLEATPASTFRLADTLKELSTDARALVSFVLEAPEELNTIMHEPDASNIRISANVRRYLRKHGWSANKLKNCFCEIKEAL